MVQDDARARQALQREHTAEVVSAMGRAATQFHLLHAKVALILLVLIGEEEPASSSSASANERVFRAVILLWPWGRRYHRPLPLPHVRDPTRPDAHLHADLILPQVGETTRPDAQLHHPRLLLRGKRRHGTGFRSAPRHARLHWDCRRSSRRWCHLFIGKIET